MAKTFTRQRNLLIASVINDVISKTIEDMANFFNIDKSGELFKEYLNISIQDHPETIMVPAVNMIEKYFDIDDEECIPTLIATFISMLSEMLGGLDND